jgi:hypothetical protein
LNTIANLADAQRARPVLVALGPIALAQVRDHHNRVAALLPHHLPETATIRSSCQHQASDKCRKEKETGSRQEQTANSETETITM